ncbi:MAG TPA: hypothetical protein VEK07_10580 [Polyangiaceae bacterium]|nr:hypothetical protein [Polyangiaceae bacterium]
MRCSTVHAWKRTHDAVRIALAAGCGIPFAGCLARQSGPAAMGGTEVEAAACPRDAARDPEGRCVCDAGMVQAMGACIEPSLGDAFCGPAARMTADGCVFRACGEGLEVDLATGECVSHALQTAADSPCPERAVGAVASSRFFCVPSGTGCPRGTLRAVAKDASPVCVRGASCPPGSIGEGAACRSIVFSHDRGQPGDRGEPDFGRRLVVDLGAWTARVIGVDGGQGSPELCRPLQMRPDLFPVERDEALVPLEIDVTVSVPDQDVTQVRSDVSVQAPRPLSAQAQSAVRGAVATLVELFRSLGGAATAASARARVKCTVGSLPK